MGGRRVAWATAVAMLVALLVVALRHIDLARTVVALHDVRAAWVAAAILCFVSILPLWALEWRILAPHVERNTFRIMLGVVTMTSSALHSSAFFLGEAVGLVLLVTRAGLSRAAAVSVLAMDQLLVGVAKLLVLAVAAFSLPLQPWMHAGVAGLCAGVVGLLTICLAAAWNHEAIMPLMSQVVPQRVAAAFGRMGAALAPLRSPRRAGSVLMLSLAKKTVEVFAIVCVQHAFGFHLPLASGILVLAVLSLATLLPIVPGNLGVYEAAVVLAYTHLGVPPEHALGMAIVQHGCYFVALALPGYAWAGRAGISRAMTAAS